MIGRCLTEAYHLALDLVWSRAGHCAPNVFTPTAVAPGGVCFWTSAHRLETNWCSYSKAELLCLWVNSEVQCTLQGFSGVQAETDLEPKTLALLLLLPRYASQWFAIFFFPLRVLDKELEYLAQCLLQGEFYWRHLPTYMAEARIWTQGCLTHVLLVSTLACGLVWACWWVGPSRY